MYLPFVFNQAGFGGSPVYNQWCPTISKSLYMYYSRPHPENYEDTLLIGTHNLGIRVYVIEGLNFSGCG